jgi:uncharacterized membrane protein
MKVRMIFGLCLLLVSLLVIFPATTVLAQEETPPPEKIELTAAYSKLEGTSGTSFEFEVDLMYEGAEARVFNLLATGPKDWTTYITPDYPKDKQILDIRLEPVQPLATYSTQKIDVHTAPPFWLMPDPGEYQITLEASSGDVKGTIDLTAVVTGTYTMSLSTPDGRLNTTATAGKDNYFSVNLENTGSAAIDNITFSSDKPSGWTIDFTPKNIDSLNTGTSQTIDVNIKPPPKTIAGDYQITITASGKQIKDDMDIRVTVETPTIWGWVGVGIIVLVIAGVAFVFMRFSRR